MHPILFILAVVTFVSTMLGGIGGSKIPKGFTILFCILVRSLNCDYFLRCLTGKPGHR